MSETTFNSHRVKLAFLRKQSATALLKVVYIFSRKNEKIETLPPSLHYRDIAFDNLQLLLKYTRAIRHRLVSILHDEKEGDIPPKWKKIVLPLIGKTSSIEKRVRKTYAKIEVLANKLLRG